MWLLTDLLKDEGTIARLLSFLTLEQMFKYITKKKLTYYICKYIEPGII